MLAQYLLWQCVCPSASAISRSSVETAGRIQLVFGMEACVLRKYEYLQE